MKFTINKEVTLPLVRLLEHDQYIISLIVIKEFPFALQVCYRKEICRNKLLYVTGPAKINHVSAHYT